MAENKKLSLEPYKGTRDFFPKDQFIQNYIFSVWMKVAESYGYLEYNASILEETDLYRAKSGQELVSEQTYSFTDRGGRDVTIRPEMTPTVARMVAQKRRELVFPLRWFSMPNLFRYERPQRGRLREHWQLNVDIFGVDSIEADVEVISVAYNIMSAFGAKPEQYKIKVNNRKIINYILNDFLSLSSDQAHGVSKLIDRKDKMSKEDFNQEVTSLIGEKSVKLSEVLSITKAEDLTILIPSKNGLEEVIEVLKSLESSGITNACLDLSLMRGFDYYTGTVFEVFDLNPKNNRSLFGGGRYDDLVGLFEVEKVSGVGFGMGDVTIKDFLETYQLLPEYKPTTSLYIAPFDVSFVEKAQQLAMRLRKENINVAVDLTERKIAAKVKTADKENIPWILVIGEEEVKTGLYKLKNLLLSEEIKVKIEDIAFTLARERK